jgi:hypothetical protein
MADRILAGAYDAASRSTTGLVAATAAAQRASATISAPIGLVMDESVS